MAQRYFVEWKGTKVFEFHTQVKPDANSDFQYVDPDVYKAYIETASLEPSPVAQALVERIDVGKFLVAFYADPDVIKPGEKYYLSFYWDYRGLKNVERVLIIVVPDVPTQTVET